MGNFPPENADKNHQLHEITGSSAFKKGAKAGIKLIKQQKGSSEKIVIIILEKKEKKWQLVNSYQTKPIPSSAGEVGHYQKSLLLSKISILFTVMLQTTTKILLKNYSII